jgi:hypothetical protein
MEVSVKKGGNSGGESSTESEKKTEYWDLSSMAVEAGNLRYWTSCGFLRCDVFETSRLYDAG